MSSLGIIEVCDKAIERMALALTAIAMIMLAPMMFLVAADVVGRYVFNSPLPMVFEINSYFLMVLVIFFPLAQVQREREHVFVTLFTDRLAQPIRLALETVSCLIGIVTYSLIGYYGLQRAIMATNVRDYISGVVDLPVWISKWIIPIGCLIFCLQLLIDCAKNIQNINVCKDREIR